MAESQSMTTPEVVAKTLIDEHADFLREAVAIAARELIEAEEDLLAFYRFAAAHWSKLRATNPLERLNKEIGRRSDVVGIFPSDASAIRLIGAMLIEQNDCSHHRGFVRVDDEAPPQPDGLTHRNECLRGFASAPAGAEAAPDSIPRDSYAFERAGSGRCGAGRPRFSLK